MTLEELTKKIVTITLHKDIVIGDDLYEEWLQENYIDKNFENDEELLKTLVLKEYENELHVVLKHNDFKITIHD